MADIPILIMAGAEDTCGDRGEGPKFYHKRLTDAGHSFVTLRLYPDDRHELLNELDKDAVTQDTYAWIEENLTPKQLETPLEWQSADTEGSQQSADDDRAAADEVNGD